MSEDIHSLVTQRDEAPRNINNSTKRLQEAFLDREEMHARVTRRATRFSVFLRVLCASVVNIF